VTYDRHDELIAEPDIFRPDIGRRHEAVADRRRSLVLRRAVDFFGGRGRAFSGVDSLRVARGQEHAAADPGAEAE
jgi:hypothetical protein